MTQLAERNDTGRASLIEQVVIGGDLSGLSPEQRVEYYRQVCDSLSLNPLTKPFEYLTLDGRLVLYARRDCTDQLRDLRGVSIVRLERERTEDLYIVTAYATRSDGRQDSAIGAVPLVKENGEWATAQSGKRYFRGNGTFAPLTGDALANAIMKCETKAKRRVTLSICGLGFTDESELDTIPSAQVIEAPAGAPDMVVSADERIWKRWCELLGRAQSLGIKARTVTLPIDRAELAALGQDLVEKIAAREAELAEADAERGRQADSRRRKPKAGEVGVDHPLAQRLAERIETAAALGLEVQPFRLSLPARPEEVEAQLAKAEAAILEAEANQDSEIADGSEERAF